MRNLTATCADRWIAEVNIVINNKERELNAISEDLTKFQAVSGVTFKLKKRAGVCTEKPPVKSRRACCSSDGIREKLSFPMLCGGEGSVRECESISACNLLEISPACNRDRFLIFRRPTPVYMLTWIQNKDFHLRLPLG